MSPQFSLMNKRNLFTNEILNQLIYLHFLRWDESSTQRLYKALTVRQREYLEIIREEDMSLHKNVLEKLKELKPGTNVTDDSDLIRLYSAPT